VGTLNCDLVFIAHLIGPRSHDLVVIAHLIGPRSVLVDALLCPTSDIHSFKAKCLNIAVKQKGLPAAICRLLRHASK
jgi:hypothetical protein